jgi:hypothetical protein
VLSRLCYTSYQHTSKIVMCVLTRLALVSCVLAVAVAPAAHGAAVIATHGPKNLTAVSPTSTSSTPLGVSSTESFSEPSSEPSSKPTPLARSRRHVPHDEDRDVLVGPQEYGVANYFRGFGGYHQHYSPQCRFYHSRTIDLSNDLLLLPYAARVIDVSRYLNARPRSLVLQVGPRRFAPYEHFTRNCHKLLFVAKRYNWIRDFARSVDFTDPRVRQRLRDRLGKAVSKQSKILAFEERLAEKLVKMTPYSDKNLDEIDRMSNADVIDLFRTISQLGLNYAFN